MKKHTKRKLTQEQVDSINRKRDMVEGLNNDIENPRKRLIIGPDGHAIEVDTITDMRW